MITTDESPVLIIFSGWFYNDTAGEDVEIVLVVDGTIVPNTRRVGTSTAANDVFTLSSNCIITLTAGTHTIKVQWRVSGGIGMVHHRNINVIEFKR